MGACSDLLGQILTALTSGLRIRDSAGAINPAKEDGNLELVQQQIAKLSFDDDNALLTKVILQLAELKIGAVELEDSESGLRANILADPIDDTKTALYVQSASLLTSDYFKTLIGDATESPGSNTVQARLKTLSDNLALIKTKLDSLTFADNHLETQAAILNASDVRINPGREETLTDIKNILNKVLIQNTVIASPTVSFTSSEDAGTISAIDDITVPEEIQDIYLINIKNESEETDVEIQLWLKEVFPSDGTTPTWCALGEAFTVAKASSSTGGIDGTGGPGTIAQQVEGAFLAQGLGISAKLINGTSTTAFTLKIVIREK